MTAFVFIDQTLRAVHQTFQRLLDFSGCSGNKILKGLHFLRLPDKRLDLFPLAHIPENHMDLGHFFTDRNRRGQEFRRDDLVIFILDIQVAAHGRWPVFHLLETSPCLRHGNGIHIILKMCSYNFWRRDFKYIRSGFIRVKNNAF